MSSRINAVQIISSFLLISALLFSLTSSAQVIRYVKPVASGSGDGSSWQHATADLQGAIDAVSALSGGQVWVAGGLYKPTTGGDRSASFRLRNGVQVYGGFAGTEVSLSERAAIRPVNGQPSSTTLSGDIGTAGDAADNVYKVVRNEGNAGTVVLDGFVISGGYSRGDGSLESLGAGLYTTGGSLLVSGCAFSDNVARGTSGLGGAVFNNQTSLTVTGCRFANNVGEGGGGAVYEYQSAGRYENSLFLNNRGMMGGGVVTESGSPVFINSVFSGNSASSQGGVGYNLGRDAVWVNCSFLGNSAAGGGHMFYNLMSNPLLTNCVLYGNGPVTGLFVNDNIVGSSSTQINYSLLESGTTGFTGSNNLTTSVSPFVSATDLRVKPCVGTNGINSGDNAAYTGPTDDIAGKARKYADGIIDMGAYEYQQGTITSLTGAAPVVSTALVKQSFSQQFSASGGDAPYHFTLKSGSLPPGLSLSTSGVVSGTPSLVISTTIGVDVADAYQCMFTIPVYRLTVEADLRQIRYVKPVASGSGDGSSWQHATADLQGAIDAVSALSGGQVWVAAGLYKPTTGGDRSASFRLRNGVQVYGGFAGTEATLSERAVIHPVNGQPSSTTLSGDIGTPGDNTDNVYKVVRNEGNAGTVVLDGFVISGGYSSGSGLETLGAGLYTDGGSLTVRGCMFTGNTAKGVSGLGGGMFNNRTALTVRGCLFGGNVGEGGGGGVYEYQSAGRYENSMFVNNQGLTGGAVMSENAAPEFINSVFSGNSASSQGGVGYNLGQDAVWVNCSFSGNSAAGGGHMFYNLISNQLLTNCVIYGNGAATGLFVNDNTFGSSSTQINYSLLESGTTGFTGSNNLTTSVSPFVSASSAVLSATSAAVNQGNTAAYTNAGGPPHDVAGNPRLTGPGCAIDMGAYEVQNGGLISTLILQQPVSASAVCRGGNVTASVSVTGTGLSYQWYKDGQLLNPAQSSTALSLTGVTSADEGQYVLAVTGDCLSATSTAFKLTVQELPSVTVTAAPSATLTCDVNSLTLTAHTDATTYAWPDGSTGQTYVVQQTGTYPVSVTDANGCSAVSNSLTVDQNLQSPVISIQSVTVCQGQPASLSVTGCMAGTVHWATGAVGPVVTLANLLSTTIVSATCQTGSCPATASGSAVVGQVLPTPAAIHSLSVNESACPVRLQGIATGTSFVLTNTSGYVFSQVFRQIGTYDVLAEGLKTTGVYTLTVTSSNACGTATPVIRTITVGRSCP